MEPTSPESSSKSSFLSVEQLRWKRLIAFGIENAAPITTTGSTDTIMMNRNTATTCGITATTSSSSLATRPANAYATTSHFPETEVIDLFDDDDDDDTTDDETNPAIIDISSPIRRPHADLKREYHHHSTTTPPMLRRTKMKQRNIPNDEKDDDDDNNNVHSKLSHHPSIPVTTTLSNTLNTSSTEAEKQGQHDHSSSYVNYFQVATWNVWFGPWGDGSPHSNIRMKSIVHLLMEQQVKENPLYCIGFQEVVTETMRPLKTLLQQHNYRWFHQPSFNAPYRCGMAIHSHLTIVEHKWIPYTVTVMQRGFLYVRAQLPHNHHLPSGHPREIIFTTTHLESYNGKDYNGAPQRLLQIQEMCQYIQDQMKQHPLVDVAIISGDLNWDDERSTKSRSATTDPVLLSSIPSYWKDTWLEVVSPPLSSTTTTAKAKKTTTKTNAKTTTTSMVEGYTYDSKLNPMLSGSLRRRFDRILICHNHHHHHHHTNDNISPTHPTSSYDILAPQLIGTEVISPDLTWEKYNMYTKTTRDVPTAPSDHFGYIVTLRID